MNSRALRSIPRRHNPEGSAMATFVNVIEAGSFSGGARRMRREQPAASKSIAQLESKLGVRLFVRTTRGLSAHWPNAVLELKSQASRRPRGRRWPVPVRYSTADRRRAVPGGERDG
ncbi:MAG: hypothetical protein DMF84_12655 [Acidobacteria bacterium]|nr:MAG: hypothetical protein DMF84_12655 [Acidobacteriota bacterium]